jgi:hypothetical protein
MIDDMTLLKQAMEQMDSEDPAVAQAAKDRAAQTLGEAQLSFAKMAALIERRRLLLRPRIVANIRRMDQPGMLGDAAFRDTGSALRKDGQSFRQIAEAIERTGRLSPRYEESEPVSESPEQQLVDPMYQMPRGPNEPTWPSALLFVARIVFFPLRHPIRFLAIVLFAAWLLSAFGAAPPRQHAPNYAGGVDTIRHGANEAMAWLSSFFHEKILRQSKEAAVQPTPPAPTPSPPAAAPSLPSAVPSTVPAPPATAPSPSNAAAPPVPPSATPAPSSAAPARPPVSTPRRAARHSSPSRSAMICDPSLEDYPLARRQAPPEDRRPLASLEELIPEGSPRNSRIAGPCVGGVGGCSWGGY